MPAAIQSDKPHPWSMLQIVLPVAIAGGALIIISFMYYWLAMRKKYPSVAQFHQDRNVFLKKLRPDKPVVRRGTRDSTWAIDGFSQSRNKDTEHGTFLSASTSSGHVRLPSTPEPNPSGGSAGLGAFLARPWKKGSGRRGSGANSLGKKSGKTDSTLANYRYAGLGLSNPGKRITPGDPDSDAESEDTSPLIGTNSTRMDSVILVAGDNPHFSLESASTADVNVIPPTRSPSPEPIGPLRPVSLSSSQTCRWTQRLILLA
jgi:hypothetical protein